MQLAAVMIFYLDSDFTNNSKKRTVFEVPIFVVGKLLSWFSTKWMIVSSATSRRTSHLSKQTIDFRVKGILSQPLMWILMFLLITYWHLFFILLNIDLLILNSDPLSCFVGDSILYCPLSCSTTHQATTNIVGNRIVLSASIDSALRLISDWGYTNHISMPSRHLFLFHSNIYLNLPNWISTLIPFHGVTGLTRRCISLLIFICFYTSLLCAMLIFYSASSAFLRQPISFSAKHKYAQHLNATVMCGSEPYLPIPPRSGSTKGHSVDPGALAEPNSCFTIFFHHFHSVLYNLLR